MTTIQFQKFFNSKKPLIGVIHLPAFPGFKEHPGMEVIAKKALTDLETLEKAGFAAALVENDGDHPPHVGSNKQISKHFEEIMKIITMHAQIPIGLEILYDMPGTIKLAAKVGVQFVRLDVFVDTGKTHYGPVVYAQPQKIVELKEFLAPNLLLFTDVQVKHLTMLDEQKSLVASVKQAIEAGSDGIIITGTWTGKEPIVDDCVNAKKVSKNIPILIGSGLSEKNSNKFLSIIDGGIVATSVKTGEFINLEKAQHLVKKVSNLT